MEPQEKPILSDPMVFPEDELIAAILGNKLEWWNTIMDHTIQNYPSVSPVWRYYNDGKQWLFRLLKKKDTIFWTTLFEDTFRVTFYFPDRVEPLIEASNLPDQMKEDFFNGHRYGKIRGITVKVDSPQDIEKVLELVAIKFQIK
jgi:ABC-type uncharacterized transport system YnjBCD substrate-binding protein